MNTRQALLIDTFVARPVALALNLLVRLVGKLLSIDHALDKPFKTIAICKFKGMGSIIQATPMIHALRRRFPEAKIVFVSTKANQTLLSRIVWIDQVVVVDDRNIFRFIITNIASLFRLMRMRPGVYFDLEIYSDYSTLFAVGTCSKNRIGFYLRSSSFRMGIYTHMMFFNTQVPISRAYLQLAGLLGCNAEETVFFPLHQHIAPCQKAADPYIVVNPNSSDLRLERRWDKENFIALILRLLTSYPSTEVYMIGNRAEQAYTDDIAARINNVRVKSLAGRTTIDELIGIIAGAQLMISNDTGPMHIAFCTHTPVVCLFGPCSPRQYGGMNTSAYIAYKQVYCSPCVHDFIVPPCKGNNVCMKLISVGEVLSLTDLALAARQPHKTPATSQEVIYTHDREILGMVHR